ncbi:MAG: TonB-dependent receptor [Sphingomonadaceae bacterium]
MQFSSFTARSRRTALLAGAGMFALSIASPAFAQDNAQAAQCADTNADGTCNTTLTPDTADAATPTNAIVVTGSRIRSTLPTTIAPVQVIDSQEIQDQGTVNIQETLLKNPAFGTPTFSRTNTSFATSGSGLATVDLRNLGVDRTLVLVNGRRVVSGVPGSSAVDLNMIPTQMVKRVEVLTSGSASAVYGSDAVAGVVNFILKDDFQGLEVNAQTGLAQTGDDYTLDTGVLLGGNFDDGRGNATVFFGYSQQDAAYMRNHYTEAGRSDTDSISSLYFGGNFNDKTAPYYSSYPPQGRYTAGGYTFTYGPSGQLQPCFTTNGSSCSNALGSGTGPNGFNRSFYRYLAIPVDRYLVNLNAHYDITDGVTAFLEGSFASTNTRSNIEPFPFDTTNVYADGQMPIETMYNGVIYRNPFVPDAIYNAATDTNGDGLKDIFMAKRLTDFGPRTSSATQDTFRMVGGFRGEIAPKWNYEVFANYGQSNVTQTGSGQINVLNFAKSQQIVPDGQGGYMCADPTAVAQGCIPANVFGTGSLAPAVGYLEAPSMYRAVQKQTQIGANLSGLFTNPLGARDIGVVVGVEYRRESQDSRWDALQAAGLNGGNALPPTTGEFNVREAYGELQVPLISNSFIYDLSIRGAARYSDYSTVGNTFSYNFGGEFAPIPDIRFRAMYAQTVRAPNIGELFSGQSQTFPTGLQDPCSGVTATSTGTYDALCRANANVAANIAQNGSFTLTQSDIQGVTGYDGGNPNLSEEKGHTLTAGVVINPTSIKALRNLTLTADYFRVKIKDAIVTLGRQDILNGCYDGSSPQLCNLITRRTANQGLNSVGSLYSVNSFATNSGGVQTSGIDVTMNYLQNITVGSNPLRANLNVAYTHLLTGYTIPQPGAAENPFIGEVGAAGDRFTTNLSLGNDKFKVTTTGTYIGASWIDDQFDGYHAYKVHAEFYLDAQVRFYAGDHMEFYVGVDNVLDNNPEYFGSIAGAVTGMETDTGTYDPLGRRFYAGVKLKL